MKGAAKKTAGVNSNDLAKITFYLPPDCIKQAEEEAARFTKAGLRQNYHDVLRMAVVKGLEQIKLIDVSNPKSAHK